MFDSWAEVGRTGSPVRGFGVYERYPQTGRTEAVIRYNAIAEALNDDVRVDAGAGYVAELPEHWSSGNRPIEGLAMSSPDFMKARNETPAGFALVGSRRPSRNKQS